MRKKKDIEPTSGLLTDRMDIGSDEFKKLQKILLEKSNRQTPLQKQSVESMALKFQMEDYIHSNSNDELKLAGDFLRLYLNVFSIRQNKFADYIGMRPSNLNKLLNGERPFNSELALIVGKIFNIDPMLWLEIQAKNELIQVVNKRSIQLKKYSLRDLIKN